MRFLFSIGSAVFAAFTSILAKAGIEGVNSNLATAIKIARALNVSVEYLVTGSETSAKPAQSDIDITLCKKH